MNGIDVGVCSKIHRRFPLLFFVSPFHCIHVVWLQIVRQELGAYVFPFHIVLQQRMVRVAQPQLYIASVSLITSLHVIGQNIL